ncbi:universal stress protein [Actinokineospora guangxiensis]|uniref:Universal stress protein n=1 Tax=Actinokineospora guangxiensis TaxID=1490288 RepID=A0ABW0ELH1_9PSEU
MTGLAPVVVGVDGSESAVDAAVWAGEEARRLGVPLRLVHVCALPPVADRADRPAWVAELLDYGHTALDTARCAAGAEASTDLLMGSTVAVLVEESAHAREVVLGYRGLGSFHRALVGSVALALAAHAASAVVVVRGATTTTGPVVVGVDGTPAGDAALAYALAAARSRRTRLVALHAWSALECADTWHRDPSREDRAARADRVLAERVGDAADVERVVCEDRPVRALLRLAGGAALVVVGTRGTGEFAGMGLGSTSQAVLHHAPCPVAVIGPNAS